MLRIKIPELMRVSVDQRGKDWLIDSLQSAIQLEHATLPLYLTPLWSVKEQPSDSRAASLIHSIMLEEMSHMGLACNMLTTIGGFPEIDDPDFVPRYPGPLPGNVNPPLTVHLQKLTTTAAAEYMEVEKPESGSVIVHDKVEYPTIGVFYDAIQEAFCRLEPADFTGVHQQFSSVGHGIFPINSLADATAAITMIKDEGEGTRKSPFEDGSSTDPDDLAHYYKFGQIFNGRMLIKTRNGWKYEGEPVPIPETWPMATIPPGGYPDVSIDFDKTYTKLLRDLHAAWQPGGNLARAVDTMMRLEDTARALMKKEIPGSGGATYGPSWLYVE